MGGEWRMREELDIPMPSMGPSYRVSRKPPGMDPSTRRLLLIAGGIGGALLLLVGVWSVAGGHGGGVPVISADSRPLRVKPANPGGLQVAGENESIMGSAGSGGGQATLAPPPEVPALQALKAQERLAVAKPPPAQNVSLSAAPTAPAPVVQAPVVAPPAIRPQPPAAAPRPALVKATAGKVPPRVVPVPPGRGPQVQLAALGSEQAAMVEWARLTRKDPALFGGRKPSVMRVEHDGHVFWRLRTGGFADGAQASQFCARLKTTRAGCEVTRF
jgi:hypothetical protein